MKRVFTTLALIAIISSIFAYNDFQKQSLIKKVATVDAKLSPANHHSRTTPEFSISKTPTDIISNYYDYQIGSYNSIPVQLQSDEIGGIYMTFHGKETSSSNRRIYYAYINANGQLTSSSTVTSDDNGEGYPGLAVDPVSGDPFFSYHVNMDTDNDLEDGFVYDMFSTMSQPGLLTTPYAVIDNTDYPNDEYIWPYVFIGPSPVEGKRRIYLYANNDVQHGEIPSENPLFGYADFSSDDIANGNALNFSFYTIPYFDAMNAEGMSKRPMKALAVSNDGKVAFIGYLVGDDVKALDANDTFFLINDNYGEQGSWTAHEFCSKRMVDMPTNADGSAFTNPDGSAPFEGQLWYNWGLAGHLNAVFDNEGKLWFGGAQTLNDRKEGEDNDSYFPFYTFVKSGCYDPATDTFTMNDVFPQSNGEGMVIPWDQDGDGVANVTDENKLDTIADWPIYYWKADKAFADNNFKIVTDGNLKVAVWQDGLKNKYFNDTSADQDYAAWATVPEIYISLWNSDTKVWSDPISLNSIDTPELNGIIPEYVYPANRLKNIHIDNDGDTWGTLYLMYLNDNSFGSSVQQEGNADGGTVQYMAIDLNFGHLTGNNDETAVVTTTNSILNQNYPNPFNPTTTISFNMPKSGNAKLSIYNVKGELVKTLVNGTVPKGKKSVLWTGTDNNNMKVASGVYFYKLSTATHSEIKRMLLLK